MMNGWIDIWVDGELRVSGVVIASGSSMRAVLVEFRGVADRHGADRHQGVDRQSGDISCGVCLLIPDCRSTETDA